MLTSLFKALDAGPAPINFNELYSALQTKVVEGQENPLPIIATARLYEVQKSCSLTGHVWDGYWILGNKRAFEKLPQDVRAIVTREFDRSAMRAARRYREAQRIAAQGAEGKGISFIEVDRQPFREALAQDDASTRTGKPSSATRPGATWRSPRASWCSRRETVVATDCR